MAPQDTSYLFSTGALAGHPMFCDDLFFDSEDLRTFEAEHKEAMDRAVGADITEASGSCGGDTQHHIARIGQPHSDLWWWWGVVGRWADINALYLVAGKMVQVV